MSRFWGRRTFKQAVSVVMLLSFCPSALGLPAVMPVASKTEAASQPLPQGPSAPLLSEEKLQELQRKAVSAGDMPSSLTGEDGPAPVATEAQPAAPEPMPSRSIPELSEAAESPPAFSAPSPDGHGPIRMQLAKVLGETTGQEQRFLIARPYVVKGSSGASASVPAESNEDGAAAVSQDVAAQLSDAVDQYVNGDFASAVQEYLAVLDENTHSEAARFADEGMRLLHREAKLDVLSESDLDAIESALPAWDSLKSPESKHAVTAFLELRAEKAKDQGDEKGALRYFQTVGEQAQAFMKQYPQEPITVDAVSQYLTARKAFGRDSQKASLTEMARESRSEAFSWLRVGARCSANRATYKQFGDLATGYMEAFDLAMDARSGALDEALSQPWVYEWLKAEILYGAGLASFDVGYDAEALEYFQAIVDLLPDAGEVYERALCARAIVIDRFNFEAPEKGLAAFQEFLDNHPDSSHVPFALLKIAGIYARVRDYDMADSVFSHLIEVFPDSTPAKAAASDLAYIRGELKGTDLEVKSDTLSAPRLAQACGPMALSNYLARKGIVASVSELARLAEMDDEGTSMEGLISAAQAHGVDMAGVTADESRPLPTPFIAYVNANHYVMVTEMTDSTVSYLDGWRPLQRMPREAFRETWKGQMLAAADSAKSFAPLDIEQLKGAKGGDDAEWPDPNRPVCPNGQPPCTECNVCPPSGGSVPPGKEDDPPESCSIQGGDGDDQGSAGPPGVRMGGGGSGSANSGIAGALTSGQGTFGSGITAPEVDFQIVPRIGAQEVNQMDIHVPTIGDLGLSFHRMFVNRWGQERAEFSLTGDTYYSKPVGRNWFHNYQMHILRSTNMMAVPGTNPVETSVCGYELINHAGVRMFILQSKNAAGEYVYAIPDFTSAPDGIYENPTTQELGVRLYRNVGTTPHIRIEYPGGLTYYFQDPSTAAPDYYVGALTKIQDKHGNALTLQYDANKNLTYVFPPSPDDRYLFLEHSGTRIVSAGLYNGDDQLLRYVSYAYDTSDASLTRVSYPDSSYNQYDYFRDVTKNSYYISSFSDKKGSPATTFACTYTTWNTNFWVPSEIVTTLPSGLRVQYLQSDFAPGASTTVNTYDGPVGSTKLSKTTLSYSSFHGYNNASVSHFYDATNSRTWYHLYANGGRDLTKVWDPSVRTVATYAYNSAGQITEMRRTDTGQPLQFQYDASGLWPTKRIDPNLAESTYTYDSSHRIITYHHPYMGANNNIVYDYTSTGLLTRVVDEAGHEWLYEYDNHGNLTTSVDPLSNTVDMVYDEMGRVTRVIDPLGKNTYYEYADGACGGCGGGPGRITKVRDHDLHETTFTYDAAGMVITRTDALNRTVGYEYDNMNRLVAVVLPAGSANRTTYTYDRLGRVITTVDFLDKTTTYEYNFLGQLTKVTDPEGDTEFGYYANGNLSQLIDGNDYVTNFYYWIAGGLAKSVDAEGKTVKYWYDAMGHVITTGAGSDGSVDQTIYHYDTGQATSSGLLAQVDYVNGANTSSVAYAYDAAARLVHVNDWMGGAGNGNHYLEYDNAGRLTKYRDFDNAALQYWYDQAGNALTMRDYSGKDTVYTYDNQHQVSTVTAPGGKTWDYDYNVLGQVSKVTMPNGMTGNYAYDTLNRLQLIEYKDGTTVLDSFLYVLDGMGNVAAMQRDDLALWSYAYDGRHRLISAARLNHLFGSIASAYQYVYDDADNLLTKIEPFLEDYNDGNASGWLVSGTFDYTNHMASKTGATSCWTARQTTDGNIDLWVKYRKDDATAGSVLQVRPRQVDWNNHVSVQFFGDKTRLTEFQNGTARFTLTNTSATSVQGQWYEAYVRANGNTVTVWRRTLPDGEFQQILSTTDSQVTTNAMALFHVSGASLFSLDDIRAAASDLSTTTTYQYNTANELTKSTVNAVDTTYTYDSWGRTVTRAMQDHTAVYQYRYGDKVKRIDSTFPDENGLVQYIHDGFGKRRFEVVDGTENTWWRWDMGWNMLAEYQDPNADWAIENQSRTYVPGLAEIIGADAATGAYRYYSTDNLGSIRRLRDQNKASLASYEYTSYGNAYHTSGLAINKGFTGHMWDDAANMYFAPFRYYTPGNARWLTRDPLGMFDSANMFQYASQNPLKNVDLFGLYSGDVHCGTWKDDPNPGYGHADYDNLDHGWTNPFNPISAHLHFSNIDKADKGIGKAVANCRWKKFARYMHVGQDYFSHYRKGYRWYKGGHVCDGHAPDDPQNDMQSYNDMKEWSKKWEKAWREKCGSLGRPRR